MNKSVSIIITLALVLAIGIIFSDDLDYLSVENVYIENGEQYIKVNAKAGYTPKISLAKAGMPTKLIMNTQGTFDCSAALVIKAINYQNILPQNSETEIDLGTRETGETIQGLCSMGMYNFQIRFE